jgi:V/A-type H+-transporting ATPase subunit E
MNTPPSVENLDGLIQKIRQEGVERAQQEADALIAAAEERAAEMVRAAERRAAQLIRAAEERRQQDATALRQAQERAARDWLLAVRTELNGLLQHLMQRECSAALTGPALAELIRSVAVEWMRHNGGKDLALLLSGQDARALGDSFLARLQTELGVGVSVKPCPAIHAGFQIGGQGESMRFDFTDEALAESLAAYLHPRFAGVLDELRPKQEDG